MYHTTFTAKEIPTLAFYDVTDTTPVNIIEKPRDSNIIKSVQRVSVNLHINEFAQIIHTTYLSYFIEFDRCGLVYISQISFGIRAMAFLRLCKSALSPARSSVSSIFLRSKPLTFSI